MIFEIVAGVVRAIKAESQISDLLCWNFGLDFVFYPSQPYQQLSSILTGL